jgi:hypothetical protein
MAKKVSEKDFMLEELPEHVVASMEVRDRFINALGSGAALGLEFLVDDVQKWKPGQTIKVAFLGGTAQLCRDIAKATKPITEACNIKLDFGGPIGVRRWSEKDKQHKADIRVSFDKPGYFSLVGTDSINTTIGSPTERVGGRAHQCSLNLGGFTSFRPNGWRGTVLHEFLHALAFRHEHQNMRGECQNEFRWEDDVGYQPTTGAGGTFVADKAGRRPGIYTYLAGPPNSWSRAKVDHNLRPHQGQHATAGAFDRASVMLYRFPPIFYKTNPSPCAPAGSAGSLSNGDREGLRHLYPGGNEAVQMAERQVRIMKAMSTGGRARRGLESTGGLESARASQYLKAARSVLARNHPA